MSRLHILTKQFFVLTLASGLPASMIVFRMLYTGHHIYGFLLWNLLLAWLPLCLAWASFALARRSRLLAIFSAAAWLAFLPNAPYLITDIAHLRPMNAMPHLYDVTMFFSLALTGLVMGFASLAWMQIAVRDRLGVWPARLFAAGVIALTSFGVYIGRFLRWNSWDILTHPGPLFLEIAHIVHHPVSNWSIWAHVALLTMTLLFAYALLTLLPQLAQSSYRRKPS